MGEGEKVDRPVNQQLGLSSISTTTDRYSERIAADATPILPVDLTLRLPLTQKQDPEILEVLRLRQGLPTDQPQFSGRAPWWDFGFSSQSPEKFCP